jgi:hypothetical protein
MPEMMVGMEIIRERPLVPSTMEAHLLDSLAFLTCSR